MRILYNDTNFRALFKAFSDPACYPESNIQLFWDTATAYICDQYGGCFVGRLRLPQQTLALNQMTAHLLYLNDAISSGNTTALVQGAGIDKVSVTLTPPPIANEWQYWLNLSPYGQQLLALLQVASVGGRYIGGAPELAAFRRVGGYVI